MAKASARPRAAPTPTRTCRCPSATATRRNCWPTCAGATNRPTSRSSTSRPISACTRPPSSNIAAREGWVRYVPPPRDLTPAAKLAAQAEALAAATLPPRSGGEGRSPQRAKRGAGWGAQARSRPHPTPPSPALRARATSARLGAVRERSAGGEENAAPAARRLDTADRLQPPRIAALLAAVARRARAHEARGRRQAGRRDVAQRPAPPHRHAARDCNACKPPPRQPASGPDYDDMPADIDEFRHELARRIDAFVASRPDGGGDAGGAAAAPVAAAARA